MRKTVSVAMALMVLAGTLTACGSSTAPAASANAANVDVVTPYLCGGLFDITTAWPVEKTVDTPIPIEKPAISKLYGSEAVAKTIIPMKNNAYAGTIT